MKAMTRAILGLFLGVLLTLPVAAPAHGQTLDRIEAVVEGEIITQSEVESLMRPVQARLEQSGAEVDLEMIRQRALNQLVLQKIRLVRAKQYKVTVSEDELDQVMRELEKRNNLPPGGLQQALAREGVDYQLYREETRDKLIQARLVNKLIRPLVTVSEDEVLHLLRMTAQQRRERQESGSAAPEAEAVRLAQILIAVNNDAGMDEVNQAQDKARDLARQLRQGGDMAALAGQFSDDPSGLRGGEIGWFERGDLLAQMEHAVFPLRVGEVSEPVRSPQGFHVLQVLERREASASAPAAAQEELHARHILLAVNGPEQEQEALEKIRQLRQRLAEGADFAELAREHSQDGTASRGGDLGWFGRGIMVQAFDEAAFALSPGQVSEPVRSPFGWHLILVEERRAMTPGSPGMVRQERAQLEERLREAKVQARYQQWLRHQRQQAYVELR